MTAPDGWEHPGWQVGDLALDRYDRVWCLVDDGDEHHSWRCAGRPFSGASAAIEAAFGPMRRAVSQCSEHWDIGARR